MRLNTSQNTQNDIKILQMRLNTSKYPKCDLHLKIPQMRLKTDFVGEGHIFYFKFTIQYNITLLPSVNTMIARGMFCGAKYTHHTFIPIIKKLITTTATATTKIQVKSHS